MAGGILVGGIEGKPQWENFRKTREQDGPKVYIPYVVEGDLADAFADASLGGIVRIGTKTRYVPAQACPTNPSMYPLTASISYAGENFDGSGGVPNFKQAIVTICYGLQPWPGLVSDDPNGDQSFTGADTGEPILFAECEIDFGSEIHKVGRGSGFWESDGKATMVDRNRTAGVSYFRIVRHFFPVLPYRQVMSFVNKINDNDPMFGQARGKVMFTGGRTRLVMTSAGTRAQQFEQVYKVREFDHNMFPRDADFGWDFLGDALSNLFYDYVDLSPLIS